MNTQYICLHTLLARLQQCIWRGFLYIAEPGYILFLYMYGWFYMKKNVLKKKFSEEVKIKRERQKDSNPKSSLLVAKVGQEVEI